MSELTAQQEREYVEAHGVCSVHGLPLSKTPWWGYADNRHKRGWEFETEDEAIHAAYLFTLERLRHIAELEEQIALVHSPIYMLRGEIALGGAGSPVLMKYCSAGKRTLALLQRELEQLKRGMTAGGCNGR